METVKKTLIVILTLIVLHWMYGMYIQQVRLAELYDGMANGEPSR